MCLLWPSSGPDAWKFLCSGGNFAHALWIFLVLASPSMELFFVEKTNKQTKNKQTDFIWASPAQPPLTITHASIETREAKVCINAYNLMFLDSYTQIK